MKGSIHSFLAYSLADLRGVPGMRAPPPSVDLLSLSPASGGVTYLGWGGGATYLEQEVPPIPVISLYVSIKSPLSLLYNNAGSFNFCSLFSYMLSAGPNASFSKVKK